MADESEMRDAARYRWLKANAKEIVFRSGQDVICFGSFDDKEEELDAAIDSAMKKLLVEIPYNSSQIVSLCEHKGQLYLAKSDGVFRWNEQQQKFEQLQFVYLDE